MPLPRCPCLQGLGCRSSVRRSALGQLIGERHPEVVATTLRAASRPPTLALDAWKKWPDWVQLAYGEDQAPDVVDEEEPNNQGRVASSRVTRRGDTILGWFAPHIFEQGRHFVEITSWPSPVDSFHGVSHPQPFRILLLRRLRLPLPFTARSCVCGRLLDNLGHHRSACSVSAVNFGQFRLRQISTLANFDFGQFRLRPVDFVDQERDKKKKKTNKERKQFGWGNQKSPCLCVRVAGRRPATPSPMDLAYMCVKRQMRLNVCHQMRLYVCHQMRLYVCHQMRLYVCHQMRLLNL